MRLLRYGLPLVAGLTIGLFSTSAFGNSNVKVSRFWHNHQPIYWPEWNAAPQDQRVQFAEDSADLKGGQGYDSSTLHPENDLNAIFGVDDRRKAYQDGPRSSLTLVNTDGGYAMSYSGSLMDNVNSWGEVSENGYGPGWWDGNRTASSWTTTGAGGGSTRLDLLGFTHHHSLGPLLPKEVFRKEIQVFKQAWWKAWAKNANLSDHSKGFFPTEMAFSRHLVDVLVDEGYDWSLVASHHISRTSPTWSQKANPEGSYGIFSSPPNKADQLGPVINDGWWYGEGQVNAIRSWNVSPFAYQLHKVKYINPETGAEKEIIVVPSDDTLSYQYGFLDEGTGKISANISPFCNDSARPCIVIPSTDGDNAWGGGSSSWDGAAPGLMNNGTFPPTTPQDFVNNFGAAAGVIHVEDGAWIFPESDYGSPEFLKWIEPPPKPNSSNNYPNTQIDLETPGFATKFYSWAPMIAGANWCLTAEQMIDESVDPWVIHDPYDNLGSDTFLNPNIVERAWHIYLAGLDSGFNYYGGLGNDDEIKTSIATRRAVELLDSFVTGQKATNDFTEPTVLKPQRFPYNPGWYTFGWPNNTPQDGNFLKRMDSEFYVWTHAYDVSGITSIVVKLRKDNDGVNSMASNHNELYGGGSDVGTWVSIPMNQHVFPTTGAELTALADNGQIEYFDQGISPEVADYYWAKITETTMPGFRNNLLDYYIEAYDSHGNRHRSEIQHVWVEDDGNGGPPPSDVSFSEDPRDCAPLTVTYMANMGPLSNAPSVKMWISFNEGIFFNEFAMTNNGGGEFEYTVDTNTIPDNAPSAIVYFQDGPESITDNRNGQNWSTFIRDCDAPVGPSTVTFSNAPACSPVTIDYRPNSHPLQTATQVYAHIGFDDYSILWPGQVMTKVAANLWRLTLTPTTDVTQLDVVFNNGASTWDNNESADWAFPLNECLGPQPPVGFYITEPSNDVTVANGTLNYVVEGIGESVVGILSWTNELTGGSGSTFAGLNWEINAIPLGVGSNVISVTGTNTGTNIITDAMDDAGNAVYGDGWVDADNGGFGFGGWQLFTSTNDTSKAGRFLANSADVNIGLPAWGLYANSGNLSEAKRFFTNTFQVGQVFSVGFDNGFIDGGAGAGVAMQNIGGDTLWEFFFNGGDTFYSISGGTTDVGFTSAGISIKFWLTGPTNYTAEISPAGSSTRIISGNLNAAADQDIQVFRAWNNNAGQNSERDVFFNNLKLTSPGTGAPFVTNDTVTITRESANDSNGDGIPDEWYTKYGLNPTTVGLATIDTDSDQSTNWEEYINDTNPTNSASYNLNNIEYTSEPGSGPANNVVDIRVESPTSTGRLYDAFWATSLIDGTVWTPIGLDVPGNPDNSAVMLQVTNDSSEDRFYRTGVKLP